jgi:DNA-binding protein H-NS
MATYHDLKAKISKLEEQARALLKKESAGVITKIRGLMSEYGLTVQDLGLGITNMGKKMSAMKHPLPPKYKDPISGKTWSGKGKAPGWIVEATKKGKRDDFLISKAAAKSEVKKAVPAKKAATKKTVAAKPTAKKTASAAKPAATKKVPIAKKVAVAKKTAPVKPAAKPAAKATTAKPAAQPSGKKAPVAKKAAPKAKPAPKAEATAPAASTAPTA